MEQKAPKTHKLYFDKEKTLNYIDSLKLSTKDTIHLHAVLGQMRDYAKGDLSYNKLDEYMLFTGMRIKNIAWNVEAKMFPNKTPMRDEFE